MTRVYSSYPTKTVTKPGIEGDSIVPDMGAQTLLFDFLANGNIRVHGTEAELDTLEVDTEWVRQ